jgi:hypothetical protein
MQVTVGLPKIDGDAARMLTGQACHQTGLKHSVLIADIQLCQAVRRSDFSSVRPMTEVLAFTFAAGSAADLDP